MPYMRSGTSSDSASDNAGEYIARRFATQSVVDDATYAEKIASVFPDSTEKPLSDQLEPIAVVGMGKHSVVVDA